MTQHHARYMKDGSMSPALYVWGVVPLPDMDRFLTWVAQTKCDAIGTLVLPSPFVGALKGGSVDWGLVCMSMWI